MNFSQRVTVIQGVGVSIVMVSAGEVCVSRWRPVGRMSRACGRTLTGPIPLVTVCVLRPALCILAEWNMLESPTLKVNIDVGNFAVHGDDVLDAINQLGSRVVYAHLKDNLEGGGTTYLGAGILPIDSALRLSRILSPRSRFDLSFS